jgi:hypothetical protein
MLFTEIGNGGKIYDVGEGVRLQDALSQQEQMFLGIERTTAKDKKNIRYAIIGVGSVLIVVLLAFAVNKRK